MRRAALVTALLALAGTAFGQDCFIHTPSGVGNDDARAVALQADGKIVVAGYSFNGVDEDFTVIRYNPDLSLDTTFGGTGIVVTDFGSLDDRAQAVAIQPDGKIVAAGYGFSGTDNDFAVARYNPDGSPDTTFDTDGRVLVPVGTWDDASAVAIQSDAKIVVAGTSDNDFAVVRLNPDGSPDFSFDGDGKATTSVGTGDFAASMALQPDGKIILGGYAGTGLTSDVALVRYDTNGSLDTSFGTNGIVTTAIGSVDDYANALALRNDGQIFVAGTYDSGSGFDWFVANYEDDGRLDTSFDGDGIATLSIGSGNDIANAIAIRPNDDLIVAGMSNNGTDEDFAVVRFNSDGTLDNGFDGDGIVTTPLLAGSDIGYAVAIESDGRIVVAGGSYNGADFDQTLVRYEEDGSVACGQISLHPTGDGADNSFSSASGCPAGNWDCVNDQPGNAGTGPAVADDGLTTYLTDNDGLTNREMFSLDDGEIPLGATITEIEIHAHVGWSSGPAPTASLSYERVGTDGAPVDGSALGISNACCVDDLTWTVAGIRWSTAELDALEIGLVHVSGGEIQVSQIYVTVTYLSPPTPQDYFRSIGTRPDYGTVAPEGAATMITAINGYDVVTGSGTTWLSSNRGRGDVINIEGVEYMIASVDGENVLTLATPFVGPSGSGKTYKIFRQFATLQEWGDCVTGVVPCPFFPVSTSSLVLDNRNEMGVAYSDSLFNAGVAIDGSITDPDHTITLTADGPNRHYGIPGAGVVIDNGPNSTDALQLRDEFVTVEWLEILNGSGPAAGGIHVLSLGVPNRIVLRNLLVHDVPQSGIRMNSPDVVAEIYNNIVFNAAGDGITVAGPLNPGAKLRIFNNTVYGSVGAGIGATSGSTGVLLRNNLAHSNASADFSVPVIDPNSSNNLASDGTGIAHSPLGGGQDNVLPAAVNFVNAAGGDYHLLSPSAAEDAGADLSSTFSNDIDDAVRPALWDVGADELDAPGAFRINYRSIGTNSSDLQSGVPSLTISGGTGTFDVPQPINVGVGDEVTYGGGTIAFITSRVSATQFTLQTPFGGVPPDVVGANVNSISRAYNTLQGWESDRDGNLVGENRREVGVVYNDGVFNTALQINGSITDPSHYMKLTVAPVHRHRGRVGTGAAVDGLGTSAGQVEVSDDYSIVEWLEVRGAKGSTVAGVRVRDARNVLLSHLLVHGNREGLRISGGGGNDFTVRNSVMYKNDDDGIGGDELTDTVTVDNCTIYGNLGSGLDESAGTVFNVTNTISMANASKDFDFTSGTQSFNISSDSTASGPGSLTFRNATDTPTAAPNFVVFMNLVNGSEDLHLRASVVNDAVNAGTDLSPAFNDDIDATPRIAPWDIGADELGKPASGVTISSNNNQSFVVGSSPMTAPTITIIEGALGGNITSKNDIRIRIPVGFNMRWDTAVATVTLAGLGAGNVSATIKSYEDKGKTVVLDVTSDFLPSDDLSIDGLKFMSFTAPSLVDNLELEIFNDDLVSALDDKTIAITAGANPTITTDADQVFTDGDPSTLASSITISDAAAPVLVVGNVIQVVIPASLNMTWDGAFLMPSFGGPAALKVDANVNYAGGGKILEVTVNTAFSAGDYLVISDVYFTGFVGPGSGNLELEIDTVPTDTDDKTVTILTTGTVQVFTATSTSTNNHLAWVNPSGPYAHTRILAREDGVYPKDPLDLVTARLVVDKVGLPGVKDWFDDSSLTNGKTYYYTAFVFDGTDYSKGVPTHGRPFDNLAGDVKWAYSTGATAMAPPALRFESATRTYIYAVSNDSIVHSMDGSGSPAPGEWPPNWTPYRMGGISQARPPVVPFPVGVGATKGAVFVGSQDGTVYAIDADTGGLEWQSLSVGDMLQASPAGIFTNYGSPFHYLVVGTRNSAPPNFFKGLNPDTGSIDWAFDNSALQGGDGSTMGIISGGASVNYLEPGDGSRHFYFASRSAGSPDTVWCVKWDGTAVSLVWSNDLVPEISGNPNIDGSPVLRNLYGGRVYVGTNQGEVVALDAATGTVVWTYDTGDGAVKGFLFPQFGTTNVIFSTTNKIWSLSDDDTSVSLNPNWPAALIPFPSTPLRIPGTTHVLVGGSDGKLYQLDVNDPSIFETELLGDGGGGVGMPTVDLSNSLIYVGTEGGIIYAVDYPIVP